MQLLILTWGAAFGGHLVTLIVRVFRETSDVKVGEKSKGQTWTYLNSPNEQKQYKKLFLLE